MSSWIENAQTWIVLAIVLAAMGYLLRRVRKAMSGSSGAGGCGTCSVGHQRLSVKPLVTLEGLTDPASAKPRGGDPRP